MCVGEREKLLSRAQRSSQDSSLNTMDVSGKWLSWYWHWRHRYTFLHYFVFWQMTFGYLLLSSCAQDIFGRRQVHFRWRNELGLVIIVCAFCSDFACTAFSLPKQNNYEELQNSRLTVDVAHSPSEGLSASMALSISSSTGWSPAPSSAATI